MRTIPAVCFGALLLCAPCLAAAETEDASQDATILVEPEHLRKRLGDKNVRVLDVRSDDEYAKGHIPGAVRVDVGDWKKLAQAEGGLRDARSWGAKISSLGIASDTHVVVYGSQLADTARIWWLLKYVGIQHASLLNGGWEWWTKNNRPVEQSTNEFQATRFQPEFQEDRLADFDSVKKSLDVANVKVVDTRSDSEFANGRIPGSVHLEWKHLLAEDGRFKTRSELRELFRKRGIVPADTAVCY